MFPIEIVVPGVEEGAVESVESSKKEPDVVQVDPQKKGRVIQETYVLNDKAALKKKLSNETSRKEAFNAGTDARDGSNVVILMKTSFFEHVKSSFMEDLVSSQLKTLLVLKCKLAIPEKPLSNMHLISLSRLMKISMLSNLQLMLQLARL